MKKKNMEMTEGEEKKNGDGKGDEKQTFIEQITELLKYVFSEAEKTEMGARLAQCFSDCTRIEGELKSIQTQIKSDIARIEAEMTSLSEKIRSGYEHRNVKCEKVFDYRLGTVTYRRLDTGHIYREREMDENERQVTMNFEGEQPDQQEDAA